MRGPLALALLLLPLALLDAAPGRHLNYAESADRLAYAFVFGSRDTCRVIRRPAPPAFTLADMLRRPPGAEYRGEAGDTLVLEFSFGRGGRPVHMVPTGDARFLLAFANRAPQGGRPAQDEVYHLKEKAYSERLEYDALPEEERAEWPEVARALATVPSRPPPTDPLSYAFVSREPAPGRILVARQSEGAEGLLGEFRCFALDVPSTVVQLPRRDELLRLLQEEEPLLRAGAAFVLSRRPEKECLPALRDALSRTNLGSARAVLAAALLACGEAGARRTLHTILTEEKEVGARRAAVRALALAPERGDCDALIDALLDADPVTAEDAAITLAHLGKEAVGAVERSSRSSRMEARVASARVLGHLGEAAAELRLLRLVGDSEEAVQHAAASALTTPPRALLEENYVEFARALDATRTRRNRKAAYRLSLLAAHAKIDHAKVLKALVDLAPFHEQAIASLARISGAALESPADCRAWWKARE